jgi:hypothetical protein
MENNIALLWSLLAESAEWAIRQTPRNDALAGVANDAREQVIQNTTVLGRELRGRVPQIQMMEPVMPAVSVARPWYDSALQDVFRMWCWVVLLIYLGLMTLAAVQTVRLEPPRECGPFIPDNPTLAVVTG